MAFSDLVAGLDSVVNDVLSEPATYTPTATGTPVSISVVEVFQSEREGLENALANRVDNRRRWSFLRTDIEQPVIGDLLTIGAESFHVDGFDEVGTDRYRWVVIGVEAG